MTKEELINAISGLPVETQVGRLPFAWRYSR